MLRNEQRTAMPKKPQPPDDLTKNQTKEPSKLKHQQQEKMDPQAPPRRKQPREDPITVQQHENQNLSTALTLATLGTREKVQEVEQERKTRKARRRKKENDQKYHLKGEDCLEWKKTLVLLGFLFTYNSKPFDGRLSCKL
ncbi:hypothetical protein CHS0354_042857 [Potamilus streckersoni]|uniref:Uncharacterized protein n=1 Tax=Potamilus streckersoni TaxID=2493646 RepID=A0AAE0T4Y9_9BIVA|nr:hypothetical protein CHS0354_042857 [Potamilus streckersoni]